MAINALSETDAVALFDAASRTRNRARDTTIVALCLDAGPSRSELVATRMVDFDPIRGVLRIGEGATHRAVRLGVVATDALQTAWSASGQDALIAAADGRPITARIVHEQLLAIGVLAGLGQGVTTRHTRRTYGAAIRRSYDIPTVMRLSAHGSKRTPPATLQQALAAQFTPGWESPLDRMLKFRQHALAA